MWRADKGPAGAKGRPAGPCSAVATQRTRRWSALGVGSGWGTSGGTLATVATGPTVATVATGTEAAFACTTLGTALDDASGDPLRDLGPLLVGLVSIDPAASDSFVDPLVLMFDEDGDDCVDRHPVLFGHLGEGATASDPLVEHVDADADHVSDFLGIGLTHFLASLAAGLASLPTLLACQVIGLLFGGDVIYLGVDDATDLRGAENRATGQRCGQQAGPNSLVREVLHGDCSLLARVIGGVMDSMKRLDGQRSGWEVERFGKDPRDGCRSGFRPQDRAIRRVSGHRGEVSRVDVAIIGGGPAGAAAAIGAARLGAKVVVFEKGPHGRDKVCGDGLTPRAVGALRELDIDMADAHRIRGLRMIAGTTTRELDWPTTDRFPNHGAVWPRRRLDAALIDAAAAAGADVRFETEALPMIEGERVVGVEARTTSDDRVVSGPSEKIAADLTIVAAGPPGQVARMLGATRVEGETFGLAIRTYAETPRHGDEHLEAMLSLKDETGTAVPGYGWMFPAGDGTVNIGVGALSTMKGFKKLNLNTMIQSYKRAVEPDWELGPDLERPRAWRLPMSTQKRVGPGWVAIGDAAGLVNPMNGEGIDYGLESGMLAAELFVEDPVSVSERYDTEVGERFDAFLRTGRRFSFLIGHPWILKTGLRFSVSTESIANITLAVMGNLVDNETPGAAGKVMWLADKGLGIADPVLRKTRAAA